MSGDQSESHGLLQFYPFSSFVDQSFWHLLATKKLDSLRLDQRPVYLNATYRVDTISSHVSYVNVSYDSFVENIKVSKGNHLMVGKLFVTNTIEEFINKDKKELIQEFGNEIWTDIVENKALTNPSLSLSKIALIVYADLKKYRFHYWFGFPALCFPQSSKLLSSPEAIETIWNQEQINSLYIGVQSLHVTNQSYFIIKEENSSTLSVHSLCDYNKITQESKDAKIHFAFADPSSSNLHPGWPLRNYLALIAHSFKLTKCSIICLRILERNLPTLANESAANTSRRKVNSSLHLEIELTTSQCVDNVIPTCVGWEKNEKHKLMPRVVDLHNVLDPLCLSKNAVDLNLKLMRWRLVPELNLELIQATKCLILGAGTLGCYVARGLLAWGVRNITFIDNSNISYSNPVRQALYTFADCLEDGKEKALAAAESLKKIYPNVDATGINFSIPMPGHSVGQQTLEQVKKDVNKLSELIDDHDVIFLLMDTRESRWLPTMLAALKKKIVINAALGFDTFLVQRHGVRSQLIPQSDSAQVEASSSANPTTSWKRIKKISGSELGCYFCNDVVAPGNSTKDRTLDQQCTVTRPGVAMLASALAVELMVSVLQHPMGVEAPALTCNLEDYNEDDAECCLGIIPHQIRGFLSRFQQLMPTNERFDKCTACSDKIMHEYLENGFNFLLKVFNDSSYLEDITGLKQLHDETNLEDVWTLSDSE